VTGSPPAGSTRDRATHGSDHRRHLSVWQTGIVRGLGPTGWLLAVGGTIAALATLIAVARPLS
jgi:hypothetical protein